MSQRCSGCDRVANDDYQTPAWGHRGAAAASAPAGRFGSLHAVAADGRRAFSRIAELRASDITIGTDFLVVTKSNAALALTSGLRTGTSNVLIVSEAPAVSIELIYN